MIKVILRKKFIKDEIIFMPQVPQKGEQLARDADLHNTLVYRVVGVTWVVPPEGLVPAETECAIVEIEAEYENW